MKTWIVVAHRAGARLLEQEGDDKPKVFEVLDNPAGRAKEAAATSEVPEPRESAREHAARAFATELANKLQRGRLAKRYQELFLIAAPRFLGALRSALDPATSSLVCGTLAKDFAKLSDHELIARLERM
jgi:protein required for attachment to host cells